MRKYTLLLVIVISIPLALLAGWFIGKSSKPVLENPIEIITRPLDKYTIENLIATKFTKGEIEILEEMADEEKYTSYLISFKHDPDMDGTNNKTTTGMLNIPKGDGNFPLIVMFRGYVDQNLYSTGAGTRNAAGYFAENGYITVAPDFLGYAGSDTESSNIMETRFQTYVTALSLIASLDQIDKWDGENAYLWGHSNGGQIALTVLEVLGERRLPTTLWAPVSKPFPYSVLYYTDESEDRGKFLRAEIARFESIYDADLYAVDMYFDRINSPLQVHQGGSDDAVPLDWSDKLVFELEQLEKEIEYFVYYGADHNLRPNWDIVVARNLVFFNNSLTN